MAKTYLEKMLANSGYTKENAPQEVIDNALKMIEKMGGKPDDVLYCGGNNFTCSICGKYIENEYSNNAAPFEGECCDLCNALYVVPARLGQKVELPKK